MTITWPAEWPATFTGSDLVVLFGACFVMGMCLGLIWRFIVRYIVHGWFS